MPLTKEISYSSLEFSALVNKDFNYIKDNFHLYKEHLNTWLTAASCFSSLEINQFFVSQGANPHFNKTENFTNAIFQNNLELVKFYVSLNCILLGQDDTHLGGAIMSAVEHDNLDMLKYLVDLGCDIHLDNDYAFNRGIANNSVQCIKYFVENHKMTYTPDIDYNIQQVIEKNYFHIADYIFSLVAKPINFSFEKNINTLFSKGHPEIFDIFIKYDLINEKNFMEEFHNVFYFFPSQEKLYQHIKINYNTLFEKGISQTGIDNKVENILSFVMSQKYNDNIMTTSYIEEISSVPFIKNWINKKPNFITQVLIQNIEQKNNLELLSYTYKADFIHAENIQNALNSVLPTLVDKDIFFPLLHIVFQKKFNTNLMDLNKIQSYYNLYQNTDNKVKTIRKKI